MRKPKDPNHPLTRLRSQLSKPGHPMISRGDLAQMTGVPKGSIAAIETGVYQLTPDVALKISRTTGVGPNSLMRGDNPLLDLERNPLGPESKLLTKRDWTSKDIDVEKLQLLFACLFKAAEEKGGQALPQVSLAFSFWVKETIEALKLTDLVATELKKDGVVSYFHFAALLSSTK
jgi:plasmid maintenance system antidote protein VapI